MKFVKRVSAAAALALAAGVVIAQNATPPSGAPAQPGAKAPQQQPPRPPRQGRQVRPTPPPPGNRIADVPFVPLVKKDASGKLVRLDGNIELWAMKHNPLVDDAAWEQAAPLVREWQKDVDQSVIDNMDFVTEVEGGIIERAKIENQGEFRKVNIMIFQLGGTDTGGFGTVTDYLKNKNALTQAQADLNTKIYSDYQNEVMNSAQDEAAPVPSPDATMEEITKANLARAEAANRALYWIIIDPSMSSYYRQLKEMAPIADKVLDKCGLSAEQKAQIDPLVRDAKGAAKPEASLAPMREAFKKLTFEQQRAALSTARAMLPETDPVASFKGIPQVLPAPGDESGHAAAEDAGDGAKSKPGGQ